MNATELKKILDLHSGWLRCEAGGVRADLEGADLRGADLRGADLEGADLQRANLQRAILRGADLQDADLHRADLQDADLQDADLRDANLRGADLQDADLRDASLRGADLQDADLRDANLRDAILDYSCLPLWCGGTRIKLDVRAFRQLAYHATNQDYAGLDTDELALLDAMRPVAQRFVDQHQTEAPPIPPKETP